LSDQAWAVGEPPRLKGGAPLGKSLSGSSDALDLADDASAQQVFVARQPILDEHLQVVSYELLFRSSPTNAFDTEDGDAASRTGIGHCLNTFGLTDLTDGRRTFINITRSLLLDQAPLVLPPDQVVIEILESMTGEPAVLQACRALRRAGYRIALDDVVGLSADDAFLGSRHPQGGFPRREPGPTADDRAERGVAGPAARRGEGRDQEDVREAPSLGYRLFQGYFFQKPEVVSRRDVPVATMTALRLAKELYRPDLDWGSLERTLLQDVG
jgi:c-di-GMP-related signal transduction protein